MQKPEIERFPRRANRFALCAIQEPGQHNEGQSGGGQGDRPGELTTYGKKQIGAKGQLRGAAGIAGQSLRTDT